MPFLLQSCFCIIFYHLCWVAQRVANLTRLWGYGRPHSCAGSCGYRQKCGANVVSIFTTFRAPSPTAVRTAGEPPRAQAAATPAAAAGPMPRHSPTASHYRTQTHSTGRLVTMLKRSRGKKNPAMIQLIKLSWKSLRACPRLGF